MLLRRANNLASRCSNCCQHCCQGRSQLSARDDKPGTSAQSADTTGRSWTTCPELRIRRLGVRVPPSAPRSDSLLVSTSNRLKVPYSSEVQQRGFASWITGYLPRPGPRRGRASRSGGRGSTGTTTLRSVADPGNFTEVDECCLTCGQAADVFSWLALSRAVVRTQCGPSRPGGTGLGRALNTGS